MTQLVSIVRLEATKFMETTGTVDFIFYAHVKQVY